MIASWLDVIRFEVLRNVIRIEPWRIMKVAAMSHDAALDVGTCMDGSWKEKSSFSPGSLTRPLA